MQPGSKVRIKLQSGMLQKKMKKCGQGKTSGSGKLVQKIKGSEAVSQTVI
jgi:hypothetical protein